MNCDTSVESGVKHHNPNPIAILVIMSISTHTSITIHPIRLTAILVIMSVSTHTRITIHPIRLTAILVIITSIAVSLIGGIVILVCVETDIITSVC
jgi:hypothetical protein